MEVQSPTAVSIETFLGKHLNRMEEAHSAEFRRRNSNLLMLCKLLDQEYQPPPMTTWRPEWDAVAQWWPFGVLRQVAEELDREGCKRLLYFFLLELGVRLPKGVLMPFRLKRGRPKGTEAIYQAWIAQGRPKPTSRVCDELARRFYDPELVRSRIPAARTRLRNRIRATILRHEMAVTKFAPIS
jgi:hypothetical protein